MFEELNISIEKVERYKNIVEEYISMLRDKEVGELYVEAVIKLKKEFALLRANLKNINRGNFNGYLGGFNSWGSNERDSILISNHVSEEDYNLIKKYNYNLNERLGSLEFNYLEHKFFEDNVQFYKMIMDSWEKLNKLRLDFLKFYREIKGKNKSSSERMVALENNFYSYINEKKKEIDINFVSYENKIKSVLSKYNIANDDLDDLNKSYLKVSEEVKGIYGRLTEINSNIFNLNNEFNKRVGEFEAELLLRAYKVEEKIRSDMVGVVEDFTKELSETDVLIKTELNSIQNTSQSFKDFISDETSIKLTNDYKSKALWEMRAYYFFNFMSLAIISFALYFSYSSLSDFAVKHNGNYTSLDLTYLGIRLLFSILIFSTITFTSRLASKSYVYWKKNEGIFLRLTALKSFIADMSDTKKEEIHEKLVDVYFGKDEQDQNFNQKMKDLPNNITQLLGKVVEQTSVVLDIPKHKKAEIHTSEETAKKE
ncbi:hypothetical protein [Acinetobacter sp. Leaf130]|uniref:hypothetical protein n=1 Tax=Acinetobacter sp. Leaf130 TaxID=1736269 RepID=UPI0006F8049C|nr:hypothetical protein [Acinetobacter sp. Leaf130]KQQ75957.1 hypothetical protein ASF86_00220 [Acinetobacter sp. Leaf130]